MLQVTMSVTDRDKDNADRIRKALNAQNNAHATSIALSLTAFIIEQMGRGSDLLLRNPAGDLERVMMREISHLRYSTT